MAGGRPLREAVGAEAFTDVRMAAAGSSVAGATMRGMPAFARTAVPIARAMRAARIGLAVPLSAAVPVRGEPARTRRPGVHRGLPSALTGRSTCHEQSIVRTIVCTI
jgi:hypothetical protein